MPQFYKYNHSRDCLCFTIDPFVENICDMLQILFYACAICEVLTIIVTDPPPASTEYNYWYDIVDPTTGDTKSLHEIRQGDVVKGSYSLIDPDGTKRTVEYKADSKNGFKAIVRNEPLAQNYRHTYNPSNHNSGINGFIYPAPHMKKKHTPKFSVNNFVQSVQATFFTPGNETSSESLSFNRGQYFMPNYMHN